MIAYWDSSAVVRWVFKSPGHIKNATHWKRNISSALLAVECFRTIERYYLENEINDEAYASGIEQLNKFLDTLEQIPIDQRVLSAAKGQFSFSIKTLDAIHLATAKLLRDTQRDDIVVVSHDKKLNLLAKTLSFKILEQK